MTRTIRVEANLVDQPINSSEKRLAQVPAFAGEFWQGRSARTNRSEDQPRTLAEMIGTTRARVTVFMNKFRKLGLIDYNGHLEIHSSLLNVVCVTNRTSTAERLCSARKDERRACHPV
jgi:CRP/FNR family cyclic AMP-dependent transcriptional regulator